MDGPSLIFDKSTLQSLSPDESVWLENFYSNNITPLFFIETLADLEKEIKKGKTPEEIVGNIAYKTPDMAITNTYHENLIQAELLNKSKIEMLGRPLVSEGKTVILKNETGIIFSESKETEAFKRWQKHEFLEIERLIAKKWRKSLNYINDSNEYFIAAKNFFNIFDTCKSLIELKIKIDEILKIQNNKEILINSLYILYIEQKLHDKIIKNWQDLGSQSISESFPYFSYILSINLFFYFGTDNKLFLFPHPETHKIDIAYLYYLPFCKIFTSNDNLHINITKFFLRPDQTFIKGSDLKIDLAKLDSYYSSLPKKIKDTGISTFAPCPPDDLSFLTTQIWDKYMSKDWRDIKNKIRNFKENKPESEQYILTKIKNMLNKSTQIDDNFLKNSDDADSIIIRHMVPFKKGKWNKFPQEVLKSKPLIED